MDNAEAVPVGEAELRGVALEAAPVGVGATEAPRRELSEAEARDVVLAEVAERLALAARLPIPPTPPEPPRLRAEAAVLRTVLRDTGTAQHRDNRIVQETWVFFTIVAQLEHRNWLVVYGWSVFLSQFGHL